MERIRKPLHYILVVYTRVLYGRSFIDLVHLPLDLRQVGPKCGWLTCHTAKSRCSQGIRAQSVLQYIYISWSLSACSLGFALSTCSPHYIYVTRWRLRVHLLGFAIFTVSHPLLTRSKKDCVGLLSLSPLTAGEGGIRIPSHQEGEEV